MRDALEEMYFGQISEGRMKDIYQMQQDGKTAKEIAVESLNIAADICVYTNHNLVTEEIKL